MSYEVRITIGGFDAVITPSDDYDGETSGSFVDVAALGDRLHVATYYLDALANAIWGAVGDSVFLAGLKESSKTLQNLSESIRSTWRIGEA